MEERRRAKRIVWITFGLVVLSVLVMAVAARVLWFSVWSDAGPELTPGPFRWPYSKGLRHVIAVDHVWCDWTPDNSRLIVHARFRNSGDRSVRLAWDGSGTASGLGADEADDFSRAMVTIVPPDTTVVVVTHIARPSRVQPGAVIDTCQGETVRPGTALSQRGV